VPFGEMIQNCVRLINVSKEIILKMNICFLIRYFVLFILIVSFSFANGYMVKDGRERKSTVSLDKRENFFETHIYKHYSLGVPLFRHKHIFVTFMMLG